MNTAKTVLKLYQSSYSPIRGYAFKSDLKIKWVRPEKIPCFKPAKSGDLDPMPPMDKTRYPIQFRNSKELETADENVKKLFSLEFQPRRQSVNVYINDVMDTVRRHPMDKGSIEARIARWTGAIRALQESMEVFPRNRVLKSNLKELIDKRKKHMKYLRRWDYKKFEWLIENLNVVYRPIPEEYERITRKGSLRKLTQKYCDEVVEDKLLAYKLQLQEEQPAFLQEKIRALEFIRDEQKECGVEVTVTQESIDEVKEMLRVLLEEKAKKDAENE